MTADDLKPKVENVLVGRGLNFQTATKEDIVEALWEAAYQEGHDLGYDEGHDNGFTKGYQEGLQAAKADLSQL